MELQTPTLPESDFGWEFQGLASTDVQCIVESKEIISLQFQVVKDLCY